MAVEVNSAGYIIRERRKRKGWSQTVLGDMVGMSAATIHRIEHGEKIPTDDEASMIAGMLGLNHEQLLESCVADRERISNQSSALPKSAYQVQWDYAHPANYSGYVWIQLVPAPETKHLPHDITLVWGHWQRTFTIRFEEDSLYLVHYKFNDGEGLPLFLTSSQPCYAVFGKDKPPSEALIMDIASGWQRTEPMPFSQLRTLIGDYLRFYLRQWLRLNRP